MTTNIDKTDFERILADPSASYKQPEDVLHDKRLSHQQKVTVLKLWAFDEQELEVAEGENMRGGNGNSERITLDKVLLALRKIESKCAK